MKKSQSGVFRRLLSGHGFSLAEVMVAAGMLGIVSLGVMQMLQNMNRGQKRIAQMSEIESMQYNVRLALRDRVGCRRTFTSGVAFAGPPAVPPTGGNVNPVAANPSGTPGAPGTSWTTNERIFDSNGNTVAQVGVIYGQGTGGRVQLQRIDVFGFDLDLAALPNEVAQAGPTDGIQAKLARVRLTFLKQGTQEATLGAMTVTQDIDVQFVRSGAAGTTAVDCRTEEGAYIAAACAAFGAFENGNSCANLLVGDQGDLAPGPNPGVQLPYAFQTNGDVRIQGGANGIGGAGATNGALGIGKNPTRAGSIDLRGSLAVGTVTAAAGANVDGSAVFSNYIVVGASGPDITGAGDGNFNGDLDVDGDTFVGGFLDVIGSGRFGGHVRLDGTAGNSHLKVHNNNDIELYSDAGTARTLAIFGNNTGASASGILFGNSNEGDLVMPHNNSDIFVGTDSFADVNTNGAGVAISGNLAGSGVGRTSVGLTVGGSVVAMRKGNNRTYLILSSEDNTEGQGILFDSDNNSGSVTDAEAGLILNSHSTLGLTGAYLYAPEGTGHGGTGVVGDDDQGGGSITVDGTTLYPVATRKFVENLLIGDVNPQKWDSVLDGIITALISVGDNVLGNSMSQYICSQFYSRGAPSNPGDQTAVWDGSRCRINERFDDLIQGAAQACPLGQYLIRVDASFYECKQWPSSAETPPVETFATSASGVPAAIWSWCDVLGTNRKGNITCLKKKVFLVDESNCACGAPLPLWPDICTLFGGAGMIDDPAPFLFCSGMSIANMGQQPATTQNGKAFIAGIGQYGGCGGNVQLSEYNCNRRAQSVYDE